MALTPITPRDRLQKVVDLVRKTAHYWWLIAVFAVAGAALSFAFAVTRPKKFQAFATLFYQERIQSALLSPGREEAATRNIGDRYREILLARPQLDQIIADPALDPFPQDKDAETKIDKLRLQIRFVSRGASAFRIEYTDSNPLRAKEVTDKLTKLLREKEEALRNDQAAETVAFASKQLETEGATLQQRETALNEFLAKHPEFVAESGGGAGQSEGALIRRVNKPAPGNPRLSVKERQLQRIQARLDAPPNAAPVSVTLPPTPERVAAEAAVADAKREQNAAQRELDDVLSKFTDKHPSAIKALERVNSAKERLRTAQGAVPAAVETIVQPATPEDRARLEKELQQLQSEIAQEKSRSTNSTEADNTTKRVVQLEIDNTNLRRSVSEQRERVQVLTDGLFRATMDAKQKAAEQGGRLSVIDPASRPIQPSGPGKTIFMMAGVLLFVTLGLSLAVALAVIDDRLYRRVDLDQLGIPVLAVIPPATLHKGKSKAKARAAAARKRKPTSTSEPKKRASTGAPAGPGGAS
jgi:uncharacterized protein involved in exopolysaccharide biosynthesis